MSLPWSAGRLVMFLLCRSLTPNHVSGRVQSGKHNTWGVLTEETEWRVLVWDVGKFKEQNSIGSLKNRTFCRAVRRGTTWPPPAALEGTRLVLGIPEGLGGWNQLPLWAEGYCWGNFDKNFKQTGRRKSLLQDLLSASHFLLPSKFPLCFLWTGFNRKPLGKGIWEM